MRKPRSSRITILNQIAGGKTATSLAFAEDAVARGRAIFVTPGSIRFLEDAEIRQNRALRQSMASDVQYWHDVARERGGENVSYDWRPRISGGFNVMQGRAIIHATH